MGGLVIKNFVSKFVGWRIQEVGIGGTVDFSWVPTEFFPC